jgi:bifunctional DNA-binding transcriptional regulator/antitoxin component of YhaV-PrlF toxin-antitoxin module
MFQREESAMPIKEEVRTVTATGRVIVPWSIQRALGLEHGGQVRFRVEDGVVTLAAVDPRENASPDPDFRVALNVELKTLLDAFERDRANEVATR